MKIFLSTACGAAIGTLIYTAFISSAQEPDWGRAAFVGLATGLITLVWPRKKSK